MAGSEPSKSEMVDRIATRAWRDAEFRTLLFRDQHAALLDEFGELPEALVGLTFTARPVDRMVVRDIEGGKRVVVRPKHGDRPLNALVRQVFAVPELVIVFYTKRCAYQCSFCTLPSSSAYSDVPFEDIRAQLDAALAFAGDDRAIVRQISLGNEGSILDEDTFPRQQLEFVLRSLTELPTLTDIVLETRSEYVTEELLDWMTDLISPVRLTPKIGLESADDRIREQILTKRMDLGQFESVVRMLGKRGAGLASYVLVKADPDHSDAAGRDDAIATCEYLKALCRDSGTDLVLRINSMYRAANSRWARLAEAAGWAPPSVFDLAEVMWAVREDDVPVYAGLSEEGLAAEGGHFESRPDFQPWALDRLAEYNRTGRLALLESVATYRRRSRS